MCELAKWITVPVSMDFICQRLRGDGTTPAESFRIAKDLDEADRGKRAFLIVEDIIDSGRTLYYLIDIRKNAIRSASI